MIVFVAGSLLIGLLASFIAIFAGASLLLAFLIYAGTGISLLGLVLLRAYLCVRINEARKSDAHLA